MEEFEGRLVPLLPAIFESPDSSANELAGIAELGLSEIDAGILDENAFRARLAAALGNLTSIWFEFPDVRPGITIGSSSNRATPSFEFTLTPVGA